MNKAKIKYRYNEKDGILEVLYGRLYVFGKPFASRKTAMGSVISSREYYENMVRDTLMEMAEGDAKTYDEIVNM